MIFERRADEMTCVSIQVLHGGRCRKPYLDMSKDSENGDVYRKQNNFF